MKKYSSIHKVRDKKKTRLDKVLYLIFNLINNGLPNYKRDKRIKYSNFSSMRVDEFFSKTNPRSSPARTLSDLFWYELPWRDFREKLGGEINILDIGCGDGKYSRKLQDFSGNIIDSYHGIDVLQFKEWEDIRRKNTKTVFTKYDGKNLPLDLRKSVNMIISQSALEHIEEDCTLFKNIALYITKNNAPILQVYLFPSPVCLKLYLFHGIRQYTPRTISNITRLFDERSHFELVSLGGKTCNRLHWQGITKVHLLTRDYHYREKDAEYSTELFNAIMFDMAQESRKNASFYGLKIRSNLPNAPIRSSWP